jgi:hypothetical protein
MATAALVDRDIEIGRRILATLARASVPVTISLWAFVSDIQEWRFIIATPLVDSKGPLAAYAEVNKALQKEGIFSDAPIRNIFLKSPNDRVLKSLEKESRSVPHEDYMVVNAPIAGDFVEDVYVYTGFIHVVRLANRHDDLPVYSVMYAPYEGPGGAVPRVIQKGPDMLRHFLESRLHIQPPWVGSALRDLSERGNASIPNVELKTGDLRRLGLA